MSDEDRIFELVEEADELDASLAQVAMYEEAMNLADQLGWDDLAFAIRKRVMHSAVFSGAAEKLMLAFSWCLGKIDENPDEYDEVDLFWEFKWAISNACRFPQVSLDQIKDMLNDYDKRLVRNSYSRRPVEYLRMCLAMTTGDLGEADRLAQQWPNLPRDDFADCEACELDQLVELRVMQHRDQAAIDLAEPLLANRLTCAEVPHRTLALLLEPAIRLGNLELADQLHRRGYPMIVNNSDFLPQLGKHAIYLARKRDFGLGFDLIEKHLEWALNTLEFGDRLDFYSGVVSLLRASDADQVSIRLPVSHPMRSTEPQPRDGLLRWFEEEVTSLCRQFDERNRTSFQSSLVRDWIALGVA